MTIKQALAATILIPGYDDTSLEKALLDAGLNASDTYNSSLKETVDGLAVTVLQSMLNVSSISEGGFSVSYNVQGIQDRINSLSGNTPSLTGRQVW